MWAEVAWLVGVVVLLSFTVALGKYLYQKHGQVGSSDMTHELLVQFRELKEKGDLSTEEFQRVRAVLGKKESSVLPPVKKIAPEQAAKEAEGGDEKIESADELDNNDQPPSL